ncbi:MAG: ADP-ribosylglycohydrolase family protein, partial [Sporomusa sp.]
AATNRALTNGNLDDVLAAGQYGAVQGCEIGMKKGETLAGPNMEKRIRFALYLASTAPSLSSAVDTLSDYFDCSGMAVDSVPVAFGLMAAAKGDPVEAICACVNVGNDTDTIATMAGGILGAMTGPSAFPDSWFEAVAEANNYDLEELAEKIYACSVKIEE